MAFTQRTDWKDDQAGGTPIMAADMLRIEQGVADAQNPTLAPVATSGNYTDLSGKPVLAPVATSGSYTDLSNKPTPYSDANAVAAVAGAANVAPTGTWNFSTAPQVNGTPITGGGGSVSDATAASKGVVQLAGDLGGTAAAPTVTGGTHHTHTASQVSGLATVATSGSYADLTNKPVKITVATTSPNSPAVNDLWIDLSS